MEPGARALLFQVGSDFNLQTFSGATLSMKWHSTAARARRLGVTLVGEHVGSDEGSRQQAQIAVDLQFLTFQRSRTPIYLYYGVGPTASYLLNRQDWEDRSAHTHIRTEAGAAAVLGVEWIVASWLGVSGEYGSSLVLVYGRRPQGQDEGIDEFGIALRNRGAKLGLSVYF